MSKFERISIKGFRRLQQVDLDMRDLVVMIGANGSGKTSFLDAMSMLADSASGKLHESLQSKGGLNEILTRGRSQELEISLSMKANDKDALQYSLEISPKGLSYEIIEEVLEQKREQELEILSNLVPMTADLISPKYIDSHGLDITYFQKASGFLKPNWEHNYLETSLSQVPKMYQEPENLRKSLASCTYYGALDVSGTSPIRLPQTMRPAKLPGVKGEDLVSCLYDLRESDRDRYEMVESIISAAFPDFERLNFPPVAAGTISMTWKDRNFSHPIYVHELSEGTLRFLWLVALLQSQNLSTITLLDEPEVSLHPELLRHLVYLMREASKHTQLIVATHSDRLIRFLEPHEVLICDLEDGETKMTWADTHDLNFVLTNSSQNERMQVSKSIISKDVYAYDK
ncbi:MULTISPECIES: AAA family ATPase [Pseudanabaena]|jgi:predicted ATPase|uniref:AAA family ATPase n=1 Tax=Pseudanabaena TaxID=1152 RepID=UPI00247970EF|nr:MULTISPECIES: AAA family ATPase [Pseudanabaena]MEA5485510.1 AAA family ATPase [Pseudanabaena sp. CCNP1317]WGS70649.1 AAA family ATPase [Pseudanabaena galeata CCNP1313]